MRSFPPKRNSPHGLHLLRHPELVEGPLVPRQPASALGITDLGLYYPFLPEQLETFEWIATKILPALKNSA
jgi:hypothetical protein